MSWSVSGSGKVRDVQAAIAEQFGRVKCGEPEQSIAAGAASLIDAALMSYPDEKSVSVSAWGSQSTVNGVVQSNSLSISISPAA